MSEYYLIDESIKKISSGLHLTLSESTELFKNMLNLNDNESDLELKYKITGFLTALTMKGIHEEELLGLLNVMLEKSVPVSRPTYPIIDIVGTGGDGKQTINISTTVSFILAAAGVKVAKHGNKAASSKCGSADVLQSLGININLSPERSVKMLEETNFCFLFAPNYHPYLKNIMSIRKALPVKTIFNFVGPIANPFSPEYIFLGCSEKKLLKLYVKVLQNRNVRRAIIFSGDDGMDEITLSTTTTAYLIAKGKIKKLKINPVDHGFKLASEESVKGADPNYNAQIIEKLFKGQVDGPIKEIVLLNSAYALYTYEKVKTPDEGLQVAKHIIESGQAYDKLQQIKEFSQKSE
ncbi:MAG: anthranilate phosphoribosyltransferase [Fervidobacterium sp.]|nr:anthranilate phosphoribosyltransferase [Fervidobacterium sp.]